MNNYLLPVCYPDIMPEIISVSAVSYSNAEDKFIDMIADHMGFESSFDNLSELRKYACEYNCLIGDIYDKEIF